MLCPNCSSALIVQDLPLRVARMFACQLSCPGCSRGVIACGSKRTLLMALRLIINDEDFDSHQRIKVNRSRPTVCQPSTST
jgi:hypothetical protein